MQLRANAGYSGTPLAKKLGIKQGGRIYLQDAPIKYERLVTPLPSDVFFVSQPGPDIDIAHVFITEKKELIRCLGMLRKKMRPDAALWISWPKKAAKIPTTVTEDTIREVALPLGFVDVKVCAVSDVWSGLKLVVRTELR